MPMMTYSSAARTKVSPSAKAGADIKVYGVARAEAAAFLTLDSRAQAAAVSKLVASGVLVDDCFPKVGDCDDVETAAAEEFDSECEYSDDDELAEDVGFDDCERSLDFRGEEKSSPFLAGKYAIKVVEYGRGYFRCIAPDDPYSTLRASSGGGVGCTILNALHGQFAFFRAVADWLQEENERRGGAMLAGVHEFRAQHEPMPRKDFCKERKIDESSATRYVRNCLLQLPDGSLPLESLFGGQCNDSAV